MTLRERLQQEIIVIDGAMGTYLAELGLSEKDFGDKPGCMENLIFSAPGRIAKVHEDYLKAGSVCIETNTFGANSVKLKEYGLSGKCDEINTRSAQLARKIADDYSSSDDMRYVIGSMGPTGKLPSTSDKELGAISYRELKAVFFGQSAALLKGGVDALLIETGQDLLEMKAAVNGAKDAMKDSGRDIIIIAQFTLADNNRMLLGTDPSAAMALFVNLGVDVIGMNCSAGPIEMGSAIKLLSDKCPASVSFVPNAGLPMDVDGKTVYPMGPDEMGKVMGDFASKYGLNVVGGCCGTNPAHISKIAEAVKGIRLKKKTGSVFFGSAYEGFDLEALKRPIKVGERINTLGSRKTKELLLNNDHDGLVELGKLQQSQGACILDVCSVLTERKTEKEDAGIIIKKLSESVKASLMIDSTDADVIEHALEQYPGTAFINSANMEDGGGKAERIFSLAREHGCFVVCLAIDEKGMAKTVDRKLEIAKRIYDLAVEKYGLSPYQLIFDMLTFSLATGAEEFRGSALATFKAIERVKKELKGVKTILGVSNISFGLPPRGRHVLNAVYLYHAVNAGLDMAIINPAKYIEYDKIPVNEKDAADDLIFKENKEALNTFTGIFLSGETEEAPAVVTGEAGPIEKRIIDCLVNRNSSKVVGLLDEALKTYDAKSIINDILLEAMKIIGKKFDSGEVVLPYVLQSAEIMKKAVDYLEDYLSKEDVIDRGKILLATVLGDVHDIGKNLVKMILSNNGFNVIDLGKQVPVEEIVKQAAKEHVDAVGLSALLVSTAMHMKTCVQAMYDAGLEYPVIVGGAPVNEKFAHEISILNNKDAYKGGVFYARDAFTGLKIMQALMSPEKKSGLLDVYTGRPDNNAPAKKNTRLYEKPGCADMPSYAPGNIPEPPFFGVKKTEYIKKEEVFKFLNRDLVLAVWGKNRDIGGGIDYDNRFRELKNELFDNDLIDLKAVRGYFGCRRDGSDILVLNENGDLLERLCFDGDGPGPRITDYFSEKSDIVSFQVVTLGEKISDHIDKIKGSRYADCYFMHILGVHLAEALAEYMHARIRFEMHLESGQGRRYSPGYPGWHELSEQDKIFRLLDVENNIGVRLTSEFQMVPEQSTSAMVVHNRQAKY